jgi:WD40 repeat protein
MATYALAQTVDEGMAAIQAIVFAPDSRSVAWAEADGVVRVRTLGGEWVQQLKGAQAAATGLAIAPDGTWLAASFANGSIYIWELSDGALIQVLNTLAEPATALDVSKDGSRLAASTGGGLIYVWNAGPRGFSGAPGEIFAGHSGRINDIDFSPDGSLIVSAGEDGSVRLWQMTDTSP